MQTVSVHCWDCSLVWQTGSSRLFPTNFLLTFNLLNCISVETGNVFIKENLYFIVLFLFLYNYFHLRYHFLFCLFQLYLLCSFHWEEFLLVAVGSRLGIFRLMMYIGYFRSKIRTMFVYIYLCSLLSTENV